MLGRLELRDEARVVLDLALLHLRQALEPVEHVHAPGHGPDDGVLYRILVRHDRIAVELLGRVHRQAEIREAALDQEPFPSDDVGTSRAGISRPRQEGLARRGVRRRDQHLLEQWMLLFLYRLLYAVDERDAPLAKAVVHLVHPSHVGKPEGFEHRLLVDFGFPELVVVQGLKQFT